MSLKHALVRLPAAMAATAALSTGVVVAATAPAPVATPGAVPGAALSLGAPPAGAAAVTLAAAPVAATTTAPAAAKRSSVLRTAAALKGRPYRYGATGPRSFDCSGYTKYVFGRHAVKLPRTSQQQYRKARKVSRSAARPGDLVFYLGRGGVYHVGIYAGGGKMWHSPHTGQTVKLAKIHGKNWVIGRVL